MDLGCAEFAVPGDTLEDKLGMLESHGMWLELVNDGIDEKGLKNILEILTSFRSPIKSVQAYLQRELHLLSADEGNRKAAIHHVEETIKIASKIGAQNVVTVASYKEPTIGNPRETCINTFKRLGRLAEELGVTVSIEPLGRNRTKFLPSMYEVYRLVCDVSSTNVRLMADTMHIHDNGENVAEIIREYATELAELQLRDTNSARPGKGNIDFKPVLEIAHEKLRGLMCLEYQPGLNPHADFVDAYEFVTKIISAAR